MYPGGDSRVSGSIHDPPRAGLDDVSLRVGFAAVIAVVALAGLVGCGAGSGTDNSQKIVNDIKVNGSNKLVAASSGAAGSAFSLTATISDVTCAQSLNGTQNYTCIVHFTVGSAIVQTTAYTANISGTCTDSGACQWQVTNAVPA
jgi:hypothetical protein